MTRTFRSPLTVTFVALMVLFAGAQALGAIAGRDHPR